MRTAKCLEMNSGCTMYPYSSAEVAFRDKLIKINLLTTKQEGNF